MKISATSFLKGFLWFICAFHILVGLGLNFCPPMAEFMAGFYGASVAWTPQMVYILKPLGAFMLACGIMAAAAARAPLANVAIIYGFATLFFLRAIQRVIFQADVVNAFHIAPERNMANVVFFLLMGVTLLLLLNLARKENK